MAIWFLKAFALLAPCLLAKYFLHDAIYLSHTSVSEYHLSAAAGTHEFFLSITVMFRMRAGGGRMA